MTKFEYEIKDEIGIHARPAGLLVKEAKKYESQITVSAHGKTAAATKLMAIMSMGVKCNDTVTVEAQGPDEEAAIAGLKAFFEANL